MSLQAMSAILGRLPPPFRQLTSRSGSTKGCWPFERRGSHDGRDDHRLRRRGPATGVALNKASLISQLKIERAPAETQGRRTRRRGPPIWPWALGALAVIAVAAAIGWFLVVRPDLVAVETATAKPAWSGGGQAQGGSLLDASGYVVARRAATVSSKITGKVAEVLIEEGQHVAAGQVIARLDDSNARAALDQAKAQ